MPNYRGVSAAGNKRGFMSSHGNAVIDFDTVTPTAALALNDTVDLVLVPAGTTLTELRQVNGDLDTATTLAVSIGYRSAQPDGVLNASVGYFGTGITAWRAAVTDAAPTRLAFAPITFNEDVYITATVTAAATGVSGTPSITTYYAGKATGAK